MLQRIQTLFLFGIFILSILLMVFPFQEISLSANPFLVFLIPGNIKPNLSVIIHLPIIINLVTIVLSLICISLYRNRILWLQQQYKQTQNHGAVAEAHLTLAMVK